MSDYFKKGCRALLVVDGEVVEGYKTKSPVGAIGLSHHFRAYDRRNAVLLIKPRDRQVWFYSVPPWKEVRCTMHHDKDAAIMFAILQEGL